MSTGYSWEGIRQVRATLLGARHVPERLCGGRVYLGRYIYQVLDLFCLKFWRRRCLEPATFRSLVDCWSDALPVVKTIETDHGLNEQ